jgi:streptogramin lyase
VVCLLAPLGLATGAGATSITEFNPLIATSGPTGIAAGPDGNLWFTEYYGNRVGRITVAGVATDWSTGSGISSDSAPMGIAAGVDGNLWFAEYLHSRIGRITPAATATEFSSGISPASLPRGIAAGPDGNLWFTEQGTNSIGRITPTGAVAEFSAGLSAASRPYGIVAGPDGNLWFTEYDGKRIGRITPAGVVTEFAAGINGLPDGIAAGSDGNLWFTEFYGDRIGRITPAGVVTEFSTGVSANSHPDGIAAGSDGNLWFTEFDGDRIGRITPAGAVTEFSTGISAASKPDGIAAGPDGNLWFTELDGNRIARVNIELAPVVTTGAASSITSSGAHLAGTVTPLGAPTSYAFQYGLTSAYGSAAKPQILAARGKPVAVSASIGGLRPSTRYHYRIVAANASGTTAGSDRTFTTRAGGGGPTPTTPTTPKRPGPAMRIVSRSLVLTRAGLVRITLACPLAETLGCHGTVAIQTAGSITLGRARFVIGGGRTRAVQVRVSRRGRTLVRRRHRVRARVLVTGLDVLGNRRTEVVRLNLHR